MCEVHWGKLEGVFLVSAYPCRIPKVMVEDHLPIAALGYLPHKVWFERYKSAKRTNCESIWEVPFVTVNIPCSPSTLLYSQSQLPAIARACVTKLSVPSSWFQNRANGWCDGLLDVFFRLPVCFPGPVLLLWWAHLTFSCLLLLKCNRSKRTGCNPGQKALIHSMDPPRSIWERILFDTA